MVLASSSVRSRAVPAIPSVPVSLASAPQAPSYLLDRVSGPEQRRLSEMGLVAGARIHVVNRASRDMLVIRVGGSRLALARGMADCVWVK